MRSLSCKERRSEVASPVGPQFSAPLLWLTKLVYCLVLQFIVGGNWKCVRALAWPCFHSKFLTLALRGLLFLALACHTSFALSHCALCAVETLVIKLQQLPNDPPPLQ